MALRIIEGSDEEPTRSKDWALAALVSWLACDLEASLTRLSSLLDDANYGGARRELAVVRSMVGDLVELHCGLGPTNQVGAFDLAYEDRAHEDPTEQTAG